MSVEIIREKIIQFLSSSEPEVMAISGDWGVGKTFSWNTFLEEAKCNEGIALERYSYVSLFGINSLQELKYSIFENVMDRNVVGTEVTLETLNKNTTSIAKILGKKTSRFIGIIPIFNSLGPAIEAAAFLSINRTIICIDDLERKGKNLDIKDILGLTSLLKEQKKCKVVFLLNNDEYSEEDRKSYRTYREKVIDYELIFAPTPEECVSIAYAKVPQNISKIKKMSANLGIRNIRVLKKIERLVTQAVPLVDHFQVEILDQVMHSIVLFSWSHYCSPSDETVPPVSFITQSRYALLGIGDEVIGDREKIWQTTLQAYEYITTDNLDMLLAKVVDAGFFIEGEFKTIAAEKNEQIIASKSEQAFSNAWDIYHYSFNDNRDEVIDGLYHSFNNNCKHITPLNLDGTVSLFRDLGENEKASELIETYINKRKNETEIFNMEENNLFGNIKDTELISRFNDTYSASVSVETAKQVLYRISDQNGWDQSDETILANTSIDEYYGLFKSENGRRLSSLVKKCLDFGKFHGGNEAQIEIGRRATEALRKIGLESDINEKRVRKFGISLAGIEKNVSTSD